MMVKNINDDNIINIILSTFDVKLFERYSLIDYGANIEQDELFTNSNEKVLFFQKYVQGISNEGAAISLRYRSLIPNLSLIDIFSITTSGSILNQPLLFGLIQTSAPFVDNGSRLQFLGYKLTLE